MHRFFADRLAGSEVRLPASEAHHALNVLRLRVGAEVELLDGRGASALGRIAEAGHGRAVVRLERHLPPVERPGPVLHLAFATPKGKRLDWLLEKATELGAASLQPVLFERSVAGGDLTAAKRERWLAHCIAAAKQSGLNWLPERRAPLPLADLLAGSLPPVRLLGEASDDALPVRQALRPPQSGNPNAKPETRNPESEIRDVESAILIGPEGGLTDGERAAAVGAGFVPVRLGAATLRIETAAVALLAAVIALAPAGQPAPSERRP